MSTAIRLTVALETSTRPASIAAARGNGAPVERRLTADRSHASDLLVELASIASTVGSDRDELDLVIVGTGPGSYTGLRVGTATALGLHRGSGAALVGIPSMEAIACVGLEVGEQGAVVRNAFGGLVYRAVYERTDGGVREIAKPACVQPGEALDVFDSDTILLADEDALRVLGHGTDTFGSSASLRARVRSDVEPSAATLLNLGRAKFEREGAGDPATIRPLYLRAFDARVRSR